MLTLTAIGVDRLLGLLLSLRYRQVVTLSIVRLIVVSFWIDNLAFAIILFLYRDMAIRIMYIDMSLCTETSTFCHI